jgi:hypothetical protein
MARWLFLVRLESDRLIRRKPDTTITSRALNTQRPRDTVRPTKAEQGRTGSLRL